MAYDCEPEDGSGPFLPVCPACLRSIMPDEPQTLVHFGAWWWPGLAVSQRYHAACAAPFWLAGIPRMFR